MSDSRALALRSVLAAGVLVVASGCAASPPESTPAGTGAAERANLTGPAAAPEPAAGAVPSQPVGSAHVAGATRNRPAVPGGNGRATAATAAERAATASRTYGVSAQKNLPVVLSDGTVLRANVFMPTDPTTGKVADGTFPVVLVETAYGKDVASYAAATPFSMLLGQPDYFVQHGYIGVTVDVRGTGSSEGTWSFNDPQEAEDSRQVIQWAAKLPRSNGKVGMTGASYLGITQLFAAAEVGPNSPLKAIFPMVASHSIFREAVLPGGLLNLEGVGVYLSLTAVLNLLNPLVAGDPQSLLSPLVDHVAGLLDFHAGATLDVLTKGPRSEDGAFWRSRGPERALAQVVRNGIPAYLVGGLDDLFQGGVFRNYVGLQNAWSGRATTLPMAPGQKTTGRYQALVGPWFHAGIGAGGPDLQAVALRWFDRWLKGVRNGIDTTAAPLQVIGRARETHRFAQWPLPNARTRAFQLAADGSLSTDPVTSGSAKLLWTPVSPSCQRSTEVWLLGMLKALTSILRLPEPCEDSAVQPPLPRPLSRTFDAAPFSTATTLAGPIDAEINLRATTRDAQLVAKVYDVAPNGRAVEISTGALLASHRSVDPALSWRAANGLMIYAHHPITHAAAKPLVPGQLTTLHVTVPPTVHVFQPGHRLRLVLATAEIPSLLPLPADLPNLLGGIYTVQLGGATPSRLNVPILK